MLLVVPQEMAAQMEIEDIDSAMDQFDDTIPGEDVEIIEQGETTIGGVPGKIVVIKGIHPDIGELGMRMVAAKTDDGTMVILIGATPPQDLDLNLEIFAHMQRTFQFK
jgi:hypothetical protein